MSSHPLLNQQEQFFLNRSIRQKKRNQMVQFSFISGIIVTLLVGVITSNIFRLEAKKKQQEVEKVAEELRCQVEETETQRKIATFEADRAQQELRDRIIAEEKATMERIRKLIAEGNTLRQEKQFDEAILSYQRADQEASYVIRPSLNFEKIHVEVDIQTLIHSTQKEQNDYLFDLNLNTALALIEVKHYRVAQKYLSKAFQSRPENEALNRAIEICRQKIDSP